MKCSWLRSLVARIFKLSCSIASSKRANMVSWSSGTAEYVLTLLLDVLLNHVEGMLSNSATDSKIMPFAVEAAWVTGRWEKLSSFMARFNDDMTQDFNISVASLFETLRKEGPQANIGATLGEVRKKVASSMNNSATASLSAAHELMLKCHVLTDIELIVDEKNKADDRDHQKTMSLLEGRLAIIGAYYNDKQYLLGIRRAAMELTR